MEETNCSSDHEETPAADYNGGSSQQQSHHHEPKETKQQDFHDGPMTGLRILCLHEANSSAGTLKNTLTRLGDRLYQKHGIDLVYINRYVGFYLFSLWTVDDFWNPSICPVGLNIKAGQSEGRLSLLELLT